MIASLLPQHLVFRWWHFLRLCSNDWATQYCTAVYWVEQEFLFVPSITDKTLASSSIRLMQFEFPNIEKKWNTVQSSLSCSSHRFIWTDFIHLSIVPFLTSSGWKNINRCLCVGIEKFRLPIRQCVFLILAMGNKK